MTQPPTHMDPPHTSQPVVVLDLQWLQDLDLRDPHSARQAWSLLHTAAALQGIVNRDGSHLFIRFLPGVDDFWWSTFHEPGAWLDGRKTIRLDWLEDAISLFVDQLRGVVTYREEPYAASNVASTIAGAEDRLPLLIAEATKPLIGRIKKAEPSLFDDVLDLVDRNGTAHWETPDEQRHYQATSSTKNNAYRWLASRYLAPGKLSAQKLGYYIDSYWLTRPHIQPLQNCTLTNHDYLISHRSMIIDLNAWNDESAVDEPDQPAGLDLQTLQALLRQLHDQRDSGMLHVAGFTPWAWKYSDNPGAGSAHHGVESEWELIRILSAYNAYLDADAISLAGMSNASFYQHFPLNQRYPQPRATSDEELRARGFLDDDGRPLDRAYIQFYMGDYDAAAWLNQELPRLFSDPARGTLDLSWAFNPNLDQRAPHAMHYARVHATPHDHFVTGDSGAGYVSPAMFESPRLDPSLADGYETWIEHSLPFYERYDLDITGFIIEGRAPAIGDRGLEAYARFSSGGIICHRHMPEHGLYGDEMPYARMTADIDGPPADAAKQIMEHVDSEGTQFLTFRSVLKSPTWVADVISALRDLDNNRRLTFMSPSAFMALIRRQHRQAAKPEQSGVIIRSEQTQAMLKASRVPPPSHV
ncbi:MAG: hypothetical protein RIG82_11180 [Phycisphaeraceae bacterium]